MDQARSILPDLSHELFDSAISRVASGTPLREAVDMIVASPNGALICIGDVKSVLAIGNGGFKINTPFTPQRLFELAKMDGAIVLSEDASQIICANFHLNPDPSLVTQETGMRHRSAARTSAQTESTVIAISARRNQTTLYRHGQALMLEPDEILLSRSNQGLLTMQNTKTNLERAAIRQSFLEIDDIVTAGDVARLLTRYVNLITLAAYTDRQIRFLGRNDGLLRRQLEELMHGVTDAFLLAIRDYAKSSSAKEAKKTARKLVHIPHAELSTNTIMAALGFSQPPLEEEPMHPRGFRVMSLISILDEAAASRLVNEYGSLSALLQGSSDGLEGSDATAVDSLRTLAASFNRMRNTL